MTQEFWNEKHRASYSKASWIRKPSIFAEQVTKFLPKTGRVLDIGTGQGADAAYFHSLGYEVVGTDYASTAIEYAKDKVKNVKFLEVNTEKGLPFPDQSFDVVFSHMALHYFDNLTTRKVFEDIHRVLKPGGIFATITNTMDNPEKDTEHYTKLEEGFYHEDTGLNKRYFSIESMSEFTEKLFETLLLDNKGTTYKDTDVPTLIRFIGRKI